MAGKFRNTIKRIVKNYRISIFDKSNLVEILTFSFSRLKLFLAISAIIVVSVTLVVLMYHYTSLKKTLPGYPSDYMRTLIERNAYRVDSLQQELLKRDIYLMRIQTIIDGEIVEDSSNVDDDVITKVEMSPERNDSIFRQLIGPDKLKFEYKEKDGETELTTINFFTPVKGYVVNKFEATPGHYGTDIVGEENAKISAVLDGTVVFAEWSVNTGYVITIQHDLDIISVYKHNSNVLVKQGEKVKAGQVIAIMGDEGELSTGPHLHFELWKTGRPINPEQYISF